MLKKVLDYSDNMDLKQVKDFLGNLRTKYQGKVESYVNSRDYKRIEEGLRLVDSIKGLVKDMGTEVERGNTAIEGALALTRKRTGDYREGDKRALDKLRDAYNGERGRIANLVSRLTGNRHPPLRKALEMIGHVTEQIPGYVERLSNELNQRNDELNGFKDYLRNNVEGLIDGNASIDEDISQLRKTIHTLDSEYKQLEKERKEKSSRGVKTESETIRRLSILELLLSRAKEQCSELELRKKHMQGNIDLINSQIEKTNQSMDLLQQSQEIVYNAKDFVDIQVPYVINEIKSQGSQVHSLSGIERTVEFLDRQREVSALINDKIMLGVEYLRARVEQVRQNAIQNESIFTERGKQIANGKKPVTLIEQSFEKDGEKKD